MDNHRSQILLTVAEAAGRLGLRESTIRAWLARRRLRHIKLGRAVRVPEDAVQEFIRRNTVPAREGR
jgi:excisionase family DNA binding protein